MDNQPQDKQTEEKIDQTQLEDDSTPARESSDSRWAFLKSKKFWSITLAVIAIVGAGLFFWLKEDNQAQQQANQQTEDTPQAEETIDTSEQNHVDVTKLPLGNDMYSTSVKQGYVYSCQTSYNGGGAFTEGSWIDSEHGTWDLTKKISVDGNVSWPSAAWSANATSQTRKITSKDLPVSHNTGVFPVSSEDDAYSVDRNPNSIKAQTISFNVPKNPMQLSSPQCIGGEVGIALSGVLIFNAFDAGGRDAVATEVQDKCQGHPQEGSYYHYHGYSSCFEDKSGDGEHSDLLGYAFDGFGIFGLKGENGVELSSQDLDECHGHTHIINWDGQEVKMYHYHFTQDFPYTVACFRGQPSVKALSSNGGGQQMPAKPDVPPPGGPNI